MGVLFLSLSPPYPPFTSTLFASSTCHNPIESLSHLLRKRPALRFSDSSGRGSNFKDFSSTSSDYSTCHNTITTASISLPFIMKTTLFHRWSMWQPIRCSSGGGGDVSFEEFSEKHGDYVVVNFYHFVLIEDPEDEVSKHLSFLQGLDVRGRIYINQQGINAQYSGPPKDALAYVKWLREDHKFWNILFQISPALNGHAFPRLKLHYKPSLIQLEGGTSHLPLHDPSMRATPLSPSEWRHKLKRVDGSDEISTGNSSKSILLDVRNGTSPMFYCSRGVWPQGIATPPPRGHFNHFSKGNVQLGQPLGLTIILEITWYEWDIGHFHGAQRPDVDCFRSTSFGTSQSEVDASDPLASVDKERTDILMYCTGGIRCDVYSTILRERGFSNLYTLKGGVSHYLEREGPVDWAGNLFVFDSRLSLPPSAYKPELKTQTLGEVPPKNSSFAKCYICGFQVSELRHRNCANLDCNLLFLCCSDCMNDVKGCCCVKCTHAPRRRPVLPGHQRYQKWHNYRDMGLQSMTGHQT